MKPKKQQKHNQYGFTLIELMAVMSIMAIIMGALVVDFNRQRVTRNLTIAKNETVTNLRKVQSYMLSSKNISTGKPAKFYIVQIQKGHSSYEVAAVDNQYEYHNHLESINLPSGVNFETITTATGGSSNSYNCLQVIFSAPFGAMYTYGFTTYGVNECDFESVVDKLRDPVQLAALTQKITYLNFRGTPTSSNAKYVKVSPLTGQISPN